MEEEIFLVRKGSRNLVRELDTLKHGYMGSSFTFSQCHVLYELHCDGSLNLKELSENLLVDKANLSRTVNLLIDQGQVKVATNPEDRRQKIYQLTPKGKKAIEKINILADRQVEGALALLSPEQRQTVAEGLNLYAKALRKCRKRSGFEIRAIREKDNPQVASVIRKVMTEFGAVGQGYSIEDPEVDAMFENYCGERSTYYVIQSGDQIVGCGGVAPLEGGDSDVCELRKMYFLPEARGLGFGKELLEVCLADARKFDFKTCYIETLDRMEQANSLYTKNGFQVLKRPLGKTGHCGCDRWYAMEI